MEIRNPVILAAGVLGDDPAKLREVYESGAGAVVTKSITIDKHVGRPKPNIVEVKGCGGWLNAIGLENPGAHEFARRLGHPDYPVIVSLAGSIPEDFQVMTRLFDGAVAGFELNMSCPNVDGFGHDIGDDPSLARQVVEIVKDETGAPVFVKIGYHMAASAQAAVNAGADGITAINTVPATFVDPSTKKPIFGHRAGGLSGPPIKPIALRAVDDLVTKYKGVPVIGCGGISDWRDAAEFLEIGASAVQVGTAAMNDPSALGRIARGLAAKYNA